MVTQVTLDSGVNVLRREARSAPSGSASKLIRWDATGGVSTADLLLIAQ